MVPHLMSKQKHIGGNPPLADEPQRCFNKNVHKKNVLQLDYRRPVSSLVLSDSPGRRLHQHIQPKQGMWEIRHAGASEWAL